MSSYPNEFLMRNRKKRIAGFAILFVILFFVFLCSMLFGSTSMTIKEFFHAFIDSGDVNHIIIFKIRLPRVLGGIFAGIGLSLAGCILQCLLQNDLVSPNTIGISSGGGLVVLIFISLFGNLVSFLPLAAFLGAFLTTMLIYFISKKCGNTKYTILLAGIAISSLFQALMKLIFVFDNTAQVESNSFMIGSLANIQMTDIIPSMILIAAAGVISFILSFKLDILALGDKMSSSLGVNVRIYRFIFIALASLLASSVIAYAGLIGFVGLIVPHIAKRIIGNKHIVLLPFSALLGAILVTLCDLLTRVIFAPYEVPCGILISILGVPFFIYLLIRRRGNA